MMRPPQVDFRMLNVLAPAAAAGPGPERDKVLDLCRRQFVIYLIRKAGYYLPSGGDEEDLAQEAMQGIVEALDTWDPATTPTWTRWATVCAVRDLKQAVTKANREKHRAQNEALSLNVPAYYGRHRNMPSDDTRFDIWDLPQADGSGEDPPDLLIRRESEAEAARLLAALAHRMSDLERTVLITCVIGDRSYSEAGRISGAHPKRIDNAMQRVRRKLVRLVAELARDKGLWPETRAVLHRMTGRLEAETPDPQAQRRVAKPAYNLSTMLPEQASVVRRELYPDGYNRLMLFGHLLVPERLHQMTMYYQGAAAHELGDVMRYTGHWNMTQRIRTRLWTIDHNLRRLEERWTGVLDKPAAAATGD